MKWAWCTVSLQEIKLLSLHVTVTKIKCKGYSPVWFLDKGEREIVDGYQSKGHKLLGQW